MVNARSLLAVLVLGAAFLAVGCESMPAMSEIPLISQIAQDKPEGEEPAEEMVEEPEPEPMPEPEPEPAGPPKKKFFSAEGEKPWFFRAGVMGMVYEIGPDNDFGPIFSLGKRLSPDGWFMEGAVAIPGADVEFTPDRPAGAAEEEDSGQYWIYTLHFGREVDLDVFEWEWLPKEMFRGRLHAGLGWFNSSDIGADETGFVTSVGAALQVHAWENVWVNLGATHYGMNSEFGTGTQRYHHNGAFDLSLIFDF